MCPDVLSLCADGLVGGDILCEQEQRLGGIEPLGEGLLALSEPQADESARGRGQVRDVRPTRLARLQKILVSLYSHLFGDEFGLGVEALRQDSLAGGPVERHQVHGHPWSGRHH